MSTDGAAWRELRAALRTARHNHALTAYRVANLLNWSVSRVLRCEQSPHPIDPGDLDALVRLYGIGAEEAGRLGRLAGEAAKE